MSLRTERLILRNWKESDFGAFGDMCSDPEVMRFFPSTLSVAESLEVALKIKSLIDSRGWGFWAVEIPDKHDFIGFVGLHTPKNNLPCSPCVEVGWRLAKAYWGNGYATEAAQAALDFGFDALGLQNIVSFTAALNVPSIAVMKKLGMQNTGLDFGHPDVPDASNLKHHVLYSISSADWRSHITSRSS